MSAPTINTDAISDEQKKTAKFRSAYAEILAELTRPGFAPVLCAHEAAHMIYFNQLGAKEFNPIPASIRYDASIGDYTGHLAAIEIVDRANLPLWTPGHFEEWFTRLACAHAAGGVVARMLMPSSGGGDQDDRVRFRKICDEFNKDPKIQISFDAYWDRAQAIVAAELENPQNLATITEHAAKLQPLLGL